MMTDTETKPRAADLSGRELDRAFAEAIGYAVECFQYSYTETPDYRLTYRNKPGSGPHGWYDLYTYKNEADAWNKVPKFSTAKNLFGTVLAQIDKQKWGLAVFSTAEPIPHGCRITTYASGNINYFEAEGATRGDATCRAFLLAVGAAV